MLPVCLEEPLKESATDEKGAVFSDGQWSSEAVQKSEALHTLSLMVSF